MEGYMIKMKLAKYQDVGHCQLTYLSKNDQGQKIVYCLQEDFKSIRLMRCTQEGEPAYEVAFDDKVTFERPKYEHNDSEYALELKKKVNAWIEGYERS
jgi:hypothetical protein